MAGSRTKSRRSRRLLFAVAAALSALAITGLVVQAATRHKQAQSSARNVKNSFQVRGSVSGELLPGRQLPVKIMLANNKSYPLWITRLRISAVIDHQHRLAGCSVARDFRFTQLGRKAYPFKLAKRKFRVVKVKSKGKVRKKKQAVFTTLARARQSRSTDDRAAQPFECQSGRVQRREDHLHVRRSRRAQSQTGQEAGGQMKRVLLTTAIAVAMAICAVPTASAYWTSSGSGSGSAITDTMPAGNQPTTSVTVPSGDRRLGAEHDRRATNRLGRRWLRSAPLSGLRWQRGHSQWSMRKRHHRCWSHTQSCVETPTPPGEWTLHGQTDSVRLDRCRRRRERDDHRGARGTGEPRPRQLRPPGRSSSTGMRVPERLATTSTAARPPVPTTTARRSTVQLRSRPPTTTTRPPSAAPPTTTSFVRS